MAKAAAKTNVVALRDEPRTVLEIIDAITRLPNVPVAKLQEMLELQERIEAREAKKNFDIAMNEAQSRMTGIVADAKNTSTSSKYASYEALDTVIRPIYVSLGFALEFGTADSPKADHVRVICDVSNAGHDKQYFLDIPVVTTGPKGSDVMTKTHATLSAVTYGRRALAALIFNLVVKKDDDGNAAGGINPDAPITEAQLEELMAYMAQIGAGNVQAVCERAGVTRLQDIPQSKLRGLRTALADWYRAQSRKKKPA